MANFAYIIDGQIDSVYDILPENWKNISNFNALASDEDTLKSYGWYKISKIQHDFNPETQQLGEVRRWIGEDGSVYESEEVLARVIPVEVPVSEILLAQQWEAVRKQRDEMIAAVIWRVDRYERETRLNISHKDDIAVLDAYIQALADLPATQADPYNIVWPDLYSFSGDA